MIQITIHEAAAAVAVLGAAALGVVRRVLSCRDTAFVTTDRERPSSSPPRPESSSSSRPGNDGELRERLAAVGEDTETDVYIEEADVGSTYEAKNSSIPSGPDACACVTR